MANYRLAPEAEADLYRIWLHGARQWGIAAATWWHLYAAFVPSRFGGKQLRTRSLGTCM